MFSAAENFLTQAPVPLLGLIVFGLLIGAMQIGRALRHRILQWEGKEAGNDESYIVSGALSLLALLLGFTFGLAIDRYDHRRALKLEEANAIGTTYLRAQLLEEPDRGRVSTLLRHYAENRLALAEATDEATRNRLLVQSDDHQIRLWQATATAVRPIQNNTISRPLIEAMNTTIDAGAARVAARRSHVPPRVLIVLLIYMTISAFILGFVMSRSKRSAPAILLALFASAYLLILDIDRPTGGGIREAQTPMEDVIAMIRTHPPGRFAAPDVQPAGGARGASTASVPD